MNASSPVTASVMLHSGKRLAWKASRHHLYVGWLSLSYYCGVPQDECKVLTREFPTFFEAEEWARSYARHEWALGWEP